MSKMETYVKKGLFINQALGVALMVELTLIALLNSVGDNFCEYRSAGNDPYKSLLLSYSDASNKYGVEEVKEVIQDSESLKFSAVAVALIKCPQHL